MSPVLAVAELDVLCGLLGLAPPPALNVGDAGPPGPGVVAALAERGLVCGAAPAAGLAAVLHRLARAPLALELHRYRPDALDAVAAVDDGGAVVAVRRGDGVTLRRLRPERAAAAVLELLAPLRPASGRPVRVPVAVLADAVAAAGDDPYRLVVELMRRGMAGPGARALVAANQGLDALARIGVTVRDVPGPYEITVQHNRSGHRYQRPGPPDVLVSAPATGDRLAVEIDELVHATADRADRRRGAVRPPDAGGIGSGAGIRTR